MITVLFGTESGNAEMAADDIVEYLEELGKSAEVVPMEDYDTTDLPDAGVVVIITSTYGEGELPETTQPFFDSLEATSPDLSALKFAAFGLGDSTYETFCNGIDVVNAKLIELGATQIGATGRHDAAKVTPLSEAALQWAKTLPL